MSSDVAIRIEGLGKAYTIKHRDQHVTLAEQALDRLRHPFTRTPKETFWALRDVDLEIRHGDVLGLIGRNGAGKSTLLKVLSRITAPTEGKAELFGRIGSLLEVGTGFHPELTGRENIFLNGAILGMRTAEVQRQFDAIVDFAGVERFLDTPVKRYSSGMYVRLAFAVAAHLETEILLVDEVLAVGDQEFQDRCLGKMTDVATQGRTVLFVSHNLDAVQRLCTSAVVVDSSRISTFASTSESVSHYVELLSNQSTLHVFDEGRPGSGAFRVIEAGALGKTGTPAEVKTFGVTVARRSHAVDRYSISAIVYDSLRRPVVQCDSRLSGLWSDPSLDRQTFELTLRSPWLKPGQYDVDIFLFNHGLVDSVTNAIRFEVPPIMPYVSTATEDATNLTHVLADFEWKQKGAD